MLIYLLSFIVAAALLAVDQWSKFWTDSHLALGETMPFLGRALELHCVHNYGVAWSLFSHMRWILVGVTGFIVCAVAAVIILRIIRHPIGVFAAFLILSGGIGNLMDRIFLGYVVDMLRFPFWPSYPTFNVADICVVCGCFLWLFYALALPDAPIVKKRDKAAPDPSKRGAQKIPKSAAGNAVAATAGAGNAANASQTRPEGEKAKEVRPDPPPVGTNDEWQEKWRLRQLERQGRR